MEHLADFGDIAQLLQAAGVPVWTLAVVWVGKLISARIANLGDAMNNHILQTEKRLTRLETLQKQ